MAKKVWAEVSEIARETLWGRDLGDAEDIEALYRQREIEKIERGRRLCDACRKALPDHVKERKARLPRKGHKVCGFCLGYGDVTKEKAKELPPNEVVVLTKSERRRYGDLISGVTTGQHRRTKRLVEVRVEVSTDEGTNGNSFLWLNAMCFGLNPQDLTYEKFPTNEQLRIKMELRKLYGEGALPQSNRMGADPKVIGNRTDLWGAHTPCHPDGSWSGRGAGCTVVHKPTGRHATSTNINFWTSRAQAERKLAIELGLYKPQDHNSDWVARFSDPLLTAMMRLSEPWKEKFRRTDRHLEWPSFYWPVESWKGKSYDPRDQDDD